MMPRNSGNFLLEYFIACLIGLDDPDAAADWYLERLRRGTGNGSDALLRQMGFDWTSRQPSVNNYVGTLRTDKQYRLYQWRPFAKIETRVVGNQIVRTRWDR